MSLRSDIHAANDELGPTPDRLADRLLKTVADSAPERRKTRRWSLGVRAPLALVAALLVVAIVAAVLVGGRLIRDLTNPAVPGDQFQHQLSVLEARAVNLQPIGATSTCASGPIDPLHGWWGGGPVYMSSNITQGNGGGTITAWGLYIQFQVMGIPSTKGPILLRGEDLRTGQAVLFVGAHVAGPAVGTDTVNGRPLVQHTELVLNASHPPGTRASGYLLWTIQAGFALTDAQRRLIGAPAGVGQIICLGWQIDGVDFSERLVTGL